MRKQTIKRSRRFVVILATLIALSAFATATQAGVGISFFGAAPGPGSAQITVSWQTETEVDTVAFRIVRSVQPLVQTAVPVHVTAATGSATSGASYSYVDTGLVVGQRYFYWLYQVTSSGNEYLATQAASAVAPGQPSLARRIYLPLAFHSN